MKKIPAEIFRAYDIRGIVDEQLTPELAHGLGYAVGTLMREEALGRMAVGRDGRLSGPELMHALIEGLCAAGIEVIDVGAVPTPLVYFAAHHFDCGSAIAVTGSHNPPNYNGFKLVVGGRTLAGEAIQDLYQRMLDPAPQADNLRGTCRQQDIKRAYIERIARDITLKHPLKVVVDAGNGIAGAIAPQLLQTLGCTVIPLFCEVDGNFPNHHPDPSNVENLVDLKQAITANQADFGIAFDGDGDRLGLVLADGKVIFADRLLMLFAQDVLTRETGSTIIYDVKCTGKLAGVIEQAGGQPIMWRTGHSLIKAKMQETGAALAGEMSGHFFFKERWYGFDDGIYAAARLLEIVAGGTDLRSLAALLEALPDGVSTPELKVEMQQEGANHAFIQTFERHAQFPGAKLLTIDGVRADWPDGWGLVRASNTTPTLVLRFEADDAAALARIQADFKTQLQQLEPSMVLPF